MLALNLTAPTLQLHKSKRCLAHLELAATNKLWVTMAKDPDGLCQNFSLPLLHDLRYLLQHVKKNEGAWVHDGQTVPLHYMIMRSDHPKHFNIGGDLNHFRACIQQKDKDGLYQYSKLCLDIIYEWATFLNRKATTIALVQGRALGGGFECALSADFLIAEEHSEFGFPEIMFGLFPCTGGMSLLARRVGVYQAERMMTNGRLYAAPELKEMGVIDEICPKGQGVVTVEKFIADHAKRRISRLMIQRSRHRIAPLDYRELLTVVDEWADIAITLTGEQLRIMEMLALMQKNS